MVVNMSKRIPEHVIDEIKKAHNIVDIIGEYVQLKKQGKNYFGLCPFHDEKTPSFSVTEDKQIFYCFGCKKGGNILTFLMELEGYSFYETVRLLAEQAEITIPNVESKTPSLSKESQNILLAHEWLTKLYHHLLKFTKDGQTGYDYLINRGIGEESIDSYQIGFAPMAKGFTAEFLQKKGIHQQTLLKAGLFYMQDNGEIVDRFQGRIVFPIRNHLGKTVGFSARSITNQEPKYLNSSENDLFQKNRLLYNFDLAKSSIRRENEVILFEGQIDVISAYQAGMKNVIATLGTALTENQAKLLKRYVDTVVLCYDGDDAGLEASYRAAQVLRRVGCKVKVADLASGMDPDTFIQQHGIDAFRNNIIHASDTYIHFYMRYIKKDYNVTYESDRFEFIKKTLKQIAKVESSVEREHYLRDMSEQYKISLESLNDELSRYRQKLRTQKDNAVKNRYTNKANHFSQRKQLLPAYQNAERKLIALMLKDHSIANYVQDELGAQFNLDDHNVIVTNLYAFYEEGFSPDVSLFIDRLQDDPLTQLVIEISMIPTHEKLGDQEIDDYIRTIRTQANDIASINIYREQQRIAEHQKNHIKAAEIAMQIIELQKQMKQSH